MIFSISKNGKFSVKQNQRKRKGWNKRGRRGCRLSLSYPYI